MSKLSKMGGFESMDYDPMVCAWLFPACNKGRFCFAVYGFSTGFASACPICTACQWMIKSHKDRLFNCQHLYVCYRRTILKEKSMFTGSIKTTQMLKVGNGSFQVQSWTCVSCNVVEQMGNSKMRKFEINLLNHCSVHYFCCIL